MNKDELRSRIDAAWTEFESAFEGLDEAAFTTPTDAGGWTVAIHLAHIAACERLCARRVEGRADTEQEILDVSRDEYERMDVDAQNERIRALWTDRPMGEILLEVRSAHRDLLAAIEALEDDRLAADTLPDDPSSGPLWQNIAGESFEHYEAHLPTVRALAGRE